MSEKEEIGKNWFLEQKGVRTYVLSFKGTQVHQIHVFGTRSGKISKIDTPEKFAEHPKAIEALATVLNRNKWEFSDEADAYASGLKWNVKAGKYEAEKNLIDAKEEQTSKGPKEKKPKKIPAPNPKKPNLKEILERRGYTEEDIKAMGF
jgi:hypothetical protein